MRDTMKGQSEHIKTVSKAGLDGICDMLADVLHECEEQKKIQIELLNACKGAKAFLVYQGIDAFPVSDVLDRAIAKATQS